MKFTDTIGDLAELRAVIGEPADLARKKSDEGADVVGIEALRPHQLPEDGTELVAQFGKPLSAEALDRFAGLAQYLAVRAEARGLAHPLSAAIRRLHSLARFFPRLKDQRFTALH